MKRLDHAPELLDGPLDRRVLAGNLRDLARVNRLLGGTALSRQALEVLVPELRALHPPAPTPAARSEPLRLLDVGTGAADIPEALISWAGGRGRRLTIVAVDSREEIVELAAERIGDRDDLRLEVAQGERLPFDAATFDVAHTSMVLHHLETDDAVGLLSEMARVSRTGIIVNDLDRTWWGWVGAWLLSHLLTRNRYTRHDAPLSVRRAYRPAQVVELAELAGLVQVASVPGPFRHRYALAFVHPGPAHAAD